MTDLMGLPPVSVCEMHITRVPLCVTAVRLRPVHGKEALACGVQGEQRSGFVGKHALSF